MVENLKSTIKALDLEHCGFGPPKVIFLAFLEEAAMLWEAVAQWKMAAMGCGGGPSGRGMAVEEVKKVGEVG